MDSGCFLVDSGCFLSGFSEFWRWSSCFDRWWGVEGRVQRWFFECNHVCLHSVALRSEWDHTWGLNTVTWLTGMNGGCTHLFQKASDSLGEHSTADWIVAIWEGGDLVSPVIDFLEMVSGAMLWGLGHGRIWVVCDYLCMFWRGCEGVVLVLHTVPGSFHVLSPAAPALGWLACCKHPLRRRPLRQEPHRRWPTGRCPSGRGHSGRSTPPVGEKKWGFRSLE